tara:strand:+ start:408 stop:725 length:318 start_codon:yes stop_codon:yes gene_type:complete
MPGGSKKGGGLEVGSAYKMKYNKSSFPFKTDPVDEAKKLVIENVGNTTVDSPSSDDTNFDESEKNIIKATDILYKAGYDKGQVEQATGAGGYKAAMDWATKKDKK